MELANNLAIQVDGARREPPLEAPLVNWYEGDAIAQLLQTLARLLPDEPLGELSTELADKLRARLGQPPGHDPKTIVAAASAIIELRRKWEETASHQEDCPPAVDT